MDKQNITAWFFEGGIVGIPKNLLGLMEPLGLSFEDIGKIVYLLYCGPNEIRRNDQYAVNAAKSLHAKGILRWYTDQERIDFSPMFDKIAENLGQAPVYMEQRNYSAQELNYAALIKKLESSLGRFPTLVEKQNIEEVSMRYQWSYDLIYDIFMEYEKNHRKQYKFLFFCQMAFGANVEDKESFRRFLDNLDTTSYKTVSVLRQLGKRNNPTEAQKELYLKWSALWKFSHEMVLKAVEETVSADNPNMKYVDAILKDWQEKGIKTPEDLQLYRQKQQEENKIAANDKLNKTKIIRGKMNNFQHTGQDYRQLEE